MRFMLFFDRREKTGRPQVEGGNATIPRYPLFFEVIGINSCV